MFKKNYFIFFFITIFFLVLIIVSINSNLRRNIFDLSVGFLNSYYSLSIKINLASKDNISYSLKKIDQQIKLTDFLTTESKNTYTDDIYQSLKLVEGYLNSEEEKKYFSKLLNKLIDKDQNIYEALVWKAKVMDYENYEKNKILSQIDKAIQLSPSQQDAYRFVLDYLNKKKDIEKFNYYCGLYHNAYLGGYKKKYLRSIFNGSSLTRFALQIGPKKENIYLTEGINLNNFQEYYFTMNKVENISELHILSNFLPGTIIDINNIEFTNLDSAKFLIPLKKTLISSKTSFFLDSQNSVKLLALDYEDEMIKITLPREYKNINKIKLKINFFKANLTNKAKC